MKRKMTAIIVGTVLAVIGSTLSVSAATAQKANPTPSSFSELATGDLGGQINSSSEQLRSAQLKDAQTLCVRSPGRGRAPKR